MGSSPLFFVTIAGNLVGFFQLMDIFRKENAINNIFSFNYWPSSRVIPDTINEFPFFSFLQGDLHAHMISITFQLLVILLLLDIMKSNTLGWDSILIMGLSIGFLYPLNSWDYPVYLILAILVIAYNQVLRKKDYLKSVASIAIITASSYLFYLPYHLHISSIRRFH